MDNLIGRRIGPYEIRDVIGRGGMATVYRAYQTSLNRYVAIKVLPSFMAQDEQFVARFRQEALAAGGLSHPNILRIYDADTFQGEPGVAAHYIVMDYVTGGTLADRMQKGLLPADLAADLIAQIAEALDYAHRRNIVHRDLKPSNILVDEEGRPLLADFGIAQAMTSGPRLTQTNTSIGTPEYMSPEQSEGRRVDGRSDLYSLGIVLYQMLTGRVPFQGNTPVATLYQVVHHTPPPIRMLAPQVPEYLESIVTRALAKNPEARFQIGKEMAQALRQRRIVTPPPNLAQAETRLVGGPAAANQAGRVAYTPPNPYRSPGAEGYGSYASAPARSYGAPVPPVAAPISQQVAPQRKGAPLGLIVALALVVVALVAVLGFVFLRGRSEGGDATPPPAPPAITQVSAALATPMPTQTPVVVEKVITWTTAPTETPVPATQTPVIVFITVAPPTDTPAPAATPPSTGAVALAKTLPPTTTPPARKDSTPAPAGPAPTVRPGVVFDFENFGTWKRGDQVNGVFERSAEQAGSGRYSGKLSYSFPAVKDNYVVFLHQISIPGRPPSLALRVLGDGGDHFLNVWVRDSGGEVRSFTFGRIPNTADWQTVVAPLDVTAPWPAGHIDGADNGKLDFPITFQAIVLDGVPDGGGPFKGVLYLDDLATSDVSGGAGSGSTPAVATATAAQPPASQPAAPPGAAPSGLGGHIIYTSTDGGATNVYALDVATKSTWLVRTFARQGRIRADTRVLVNGIGGGKDNLWHVRLDGGADVQNGAHPEDAYPDWSPSGVSAVFYSSLQGDGKDRLYVQWDTGTKQEPSVVHVGAGEIFGQFPTWLDSWRIAYTGCDYWGSGSNCGIYGTDSRDKSVPAMITDNPADRGSDGRNGTLLFSSTRSGNWDVYAVPYGGGNIRNLTNSPSHDFGATFSPSGGQIAFMSNRDGWGIWVMNADGSGMTKLMAVPNGFGPGWSEERLSWGP